MKLLLCTGCNTVSTLGIKYSTLKKLTCRYIANVGKLECSEEIADMAEHCLVDCIKPRSSKVKTFDERRCLKYFEYKTQLDLTKLLCTSTSIKLHILRAYYQYRRWIEAPIYDISTSHPPNLYGYREKGDYLEPVLVEEPIKPSCLPDPCRCLTYAREHLCSCRIVGISCCIYCKCKKSSDCKNPYD